VSAQPNGPDPGWTTICDLADLPVDRGVTALVRGHAVALFRTEAGPVYAVGNHDPFSRVTVLGRGIVGVRGEAPFVASTEGRHAFDLRTGVCLDDPAVSVPSYAVRVVDGAVQVGPRTP
jgi:nitrite reductase (NADH) small subunit